MKAFKRYEFTVLTYNELEKDFKNDNEAKKFADKNALVGYKLQTREAWSLSGKFPRV
jgi:hypothetical protein